MYGCSVDETRRLVMRGFGAAGGSIGLVVLCIASSALVTGDACAANGRGLPASLNADRGDAVSATDNLQAAAGTVDTGLPEAYLRDPLRLSSGVIDAWLENPGATLVSYPLGGPALVSYVRLLAGSDSRTISALIDISKAPTASTVQIEAIGIGLARASQRGQVIAPDYVAYIQKLVAESGSAVLIAAYAKALSEPETSELAPGAGQSAGAAGSPGTLTGVGGVGPSGSVGTVSTVVTASGTYEIGRGSVSGTGDGDTVPSDVSATQ